jgi:hypothetical protein
VRTVFTLSSGRSGTHYLASVIQANATDCFCVHEPWFYNPGMFGKPIHAYAVGNDAPIRRLLERKQKYIARKSPKTYVETSHAFLKSYWHLAPEYFPDLRLIHVVRDPMKVACSEVQRFLLGERAHVPFLTNYRAQDGRWYPLWALTGLEPIYHSFDFQALTLFQRYLIQWIEIENRAMQCLDRFQMHNHCFFLHSTQDLNDPAKLQELFGFLGLKQRRAELVLPKSYRARNINLGQFQLTAEEHDEQSAAVLRQLPAEFLQIFLRPPYANLPWVGRFTRQLQANRHAPPSPAVAPNPPVDQLVRD